MLQHKQNYAICNDFKCAANVSTKDDFPVSLKKIIHFDS